MLRSGFVLLVVLYHATYLGPVLHPELLPRRYSFDHQVGASLLLVISAYFACATLGRHSPGRYWWGRVCRLLPAFLVAVPVAWTVLRLGAPAEWGTPPSRELWINWLMLGNWDTVRFPWLDPAFWTLPLQLMAFTAAAVLSTTRWGSGRRLRVLLWAMVLVPLLLWPLRARPGDPAEPPEWYRMVIDGFGFHRLHLFVAGIVIWLWSTGRTRTAHAIALLGMCGIAQWLHAFVPGPDGVVWLDRDHVDLAAVAMVCAGIALVALVARLPRPGAWTPAPLAAAFRWLAGISYGVYLMHQTAGYVLMRRLQDAGAGPLVQCTAMLATAVLLGWLLTRCVERPAHAALMRTWDRWAAARDTRERVNA
ncbi:acyltransferase [Pseudonocardia sp. C8]|nr:acyltransferase [Pseudonocardia sp. C8]